MSYKLTIKRIPQTHSKPTKVVSLRIPVCLITKINEVSRCANTSRNEIISRMIEYSIKEMHLN
ncbi:MAG: hypothetical protein ACLVML_04460 [Candidatus Gastranaerophilaceae bacterium]|jgi:metal-responsive CopG/Arc/MetJ family transcriptional regulator|nr:hypothetical protein [Christensenellales bacterium]